ncbi:unnamed protein product [Boreogadus saida]
MDDEIVEGQEPEKKIAHGKKRGENEIHWLLSQKSTSAPGPETQHRGPEMRPKASRHSETDRQRTKGE